MCGFEDKFAGFICLWLTMEDLVIILSSISKKRSSFLSLICSKRAVARLVCMSMLFLRSSNSGSELEDGGNVTLMDNHLRRALPDR